VQEELRRREEPQAPAGYSTKRERKANARREAKKKAARSAARGRPAMKDEP
jgi:hypothetical protein